MPDYLDLRDLDEVTSSSVEQARVLKAVGRGGIDARVVGGRTCLLRTEVELWLRIERQRFWERGTSCA